MLELDEIVWQLLASIPQGRVATYGQLATLAGFPNHARYVGTILKNLPCDTSLPWHRVINVKGELSFPVTSDKFLLQKTLLEGEGVVFSGNKVSLRKYQF